MLIPLRHFMYQMSPQAVKCLGWKQNSIYNWSPTTKTGEDKKKKKTEFFTSGPGCGSGYSIAVIGQLK